jgi:hypothetical protein
MHRQMCHLVIDSSIDVQKMAYQLLRGAAAKRTEVIVIEAGVDAEGTFKPELPHQLVELLARPIDIAESSIQVRPLLTQDMLVLTCTFIRRCSATYWDGCSLLISSKTQSVTQCRSFALPH